MNLSYIVCFPLISFPGKMKYLNLYEQIVDFYEIKSKRLTNKNPNFGFSNQQKKNRSNFRF